MVTVGVLATLISIITLIVVAVADRAIELIVRNFATSRLITHRRAPVVHDSDTWLPFLPRSVVKYHRNPAILCTVLCTILLITAELVSELGVDVSKTCNPIAKTGSVIAPGSITDSFTDIELSGTCFLVQSLQFDEGLLQKVQAGIPRRLTGRECFKCLNATKNPDILSGCKVSPIKQFKAGEVDITLETTIGPFKTITKAFKDKSANKTYQGYGDLTHNGNSTSTYIIYKDENRASLFYFEYNDQDHLKKMRGLVQRGQPLTQPTKGPVHVFEITCEVNVLDMSKFAEMLMMYRTIQLENPISPAILDPKTNQFDVITPDTVYRAVLAGKIIDDVHNGNSEFHVYTECGKYNWSFILPLIVCLAILLLLGAASHLFRAEGSFEIPFNSRSWYHHARKLESLSIPSPVYRKRRRGYFGNIFDELKLEDDDDEFYPHGRIVLLTRDDDVPPEPSGFVGAGGVQVPPPVFDSFEGNP